MTGQICMEQLANEIYGENSKEYEEFIEKFKPKRTTDDCYTPPAVYDAVADWVAKEYGLNRADFVRPFYPGGDYESEEYPEECIVVDNPPFSILARIVDFYLAQGVRFFLFAPGLTTIGITCREGVCAICTDAQITYENGALVRSNFATNMDPEFCARSVPELGKAIANAQKKTSASRPKLGHDMHVVSSAALNKLAKYGVDFRIPRNKAAFVRSYGNGQKVFGGGLLVAGDIAAERVAAERAAAERAATPMIQLSSADRKIVEKLNAAKG